MKPLGVKLKGKEKFTKKRISMMQLDAARPKKPDWIRVKLPSAKAHADFARVKKILRQYQLHTVCEEASCPNISECFSGGTATFMIMGDICTRRCPFCDVGHGRPLPLDEKEPVHLAKAIAELKLRHVVITSVNRDDLKDGGAHHFAACIEAIRQRLDSIVIEVLVPDFRKHADLAIETLVQHQPDVVNHNLETVPSLYRQVRPGADYQQSVALLGSFKQRFAPHVLTKSGLMLGVGETYDEVVAVLRDLREAKVDMVTLGQYLQPTAYHLPVERFVDPSEFDALRDVALELGFVHVASGPLVRSSYHAEAQLHQ